MLLIIINDTYIWRHVFYTQHTTKNTSSISWVGLEKVFFSSILIVEIRIKLMLSLIYILVLQMLLLLLQYVAKRAGAIL